MKTKIQFSDIYNSFDSNMQALYLLHVAIEDSIGGEEWTTLRDYYQDIYSLFGDDVDPLEVQVILERLIKIDVEDDTLDFKKVWQAMDIDSNEVYSLEDGKYVMSKEYQEGLKEWAKTYPESANRFFRAYLKTQRQGVFKSELSRQGLLLSAVSQFEFLLLHLIRAYFVYYEKDDALSEEFEIEDLDEYISKKLETYFAQRESKGKVQFAKDLRNLSSSRKIDFLLDKFPLQGISREKLKEIFERRNVFTHRSGRAHQVYVDAAKALYGKSPVVVGSKLRISKNYVKDAIEYLHLWGLIVCQKVWRKLETHDSKINRSISNTAMEFIRNERYKIGLAFCEKVIDNLNFKSQTNKEVILINYAICSDKLGDIRLRDKLLGRIRQTPPQSAPAITGINLQVASEPISNSVLMAVNALKGNKQRALDFMEKAADVDEITFLDLDYWVIFDYLRDDPRFSEIEKRLESKVKIA